MTREEIICSFIIGIASGIVSSLIVTILYRIKDRERDRQVYFSEWRLYLSKLIGASIQNIDSFSAFFSSNEIPKANKWIHLKKDERKVICDVNMKVLDLETIIEKYYTRENELLDLVCSGEKTTEEIEFMVQKEYLPQVAHAQALITKEAIRVQSLGNKIMQDVMKNNRNGK